MLILLSLILLFYAKAITGQINLALRQNGSLIVCCS